MGLNEQLPILYSLQNCPYAIRARFILYKAQQRVLIRAIKLNNKPVEMLTTSKKGSVPVLVVENKTVIDESLDIMLWALHKNDPSDLLHCIDCNSLNDILELINTFETTFIPPLENYCCSKRYHEDNLDECRTVCEMTLKDLEFRLSKHHFLYSDKESLLDIALFPFLRKFARVERQWYLHSPYINLRNWLNKYLQSTAFTKVMTKHELWVENKKDIFFPE